MSKKKPLKIKIESTYKSYSHLYKDGFPAAELDIDYAHTGLFIKVESLGEYGTSLARIELTLEQTNELIDKLLKYRSSLEDK